MTINDAVARRTIKLMSRKGYTQHKVEKLSGLTHGAMGRILAGKNETVTFTTIYRLADAFDMTIQEFLDDKIFDKNNVDYN